MPIMARDSGGGDFVLAPAGNHNSVCVDVIDLGLQKIPAGIYGPEDIKHQVRFMWEIDEEMDDGRRFVIGRTFNLTLHENSSLRPILESWRSKPFTEEERAGFDVERVLTAPAMVQILHEAGKKAGTMFANVKTVTPLPKGMARIQKRDYQRSKRDQDMATAGQALLNSSSPQDAEPVAPSDYDDYDDSVIPF